MTKNNETTDKPTEPSPASATPAEGAPAEGAAAPRTRKIVRRSATTREHIATPAGDEGRAADVAAPSDPAAAPAAPPAHAATIPGEGAPRPRATFDARAPRPARPVGEAPRGPRPQGDRGGRPPRSGGDFRGNRGGGSGDFRPPPATPMGARPIPGGSRAPAPEGSPYPQQRRDGDYRPPPARPIGARPTPGGSRAPAPEGARPERRPDDRRPPRNEGDRGAPRAEQERGERPAQAPAQARPQAPQARPAQPAAKAAPPQKVAAPKARPVPILLNVPPPRAGSAAGKPALTAKEALSLRAKAASSTKVEAPKPRKTEGEGSASTFDDALLAVGPDGAKAALKAVGEQASALVDAWVGANNAAAIVAVAEAGDVASAARKAARRGLNVLRARGVAIPETTHVVRMDDRAEVSIEATYLPPDPSGTSSVTITSKDASGRYHIAEVIIREPLGIIQAGAGWLSGSQLKEGRARASEGLGVAPVAVPVEWARHMIGAARALNASSKYVVPLGFERCRDLVEPAPESAPAHPVADLEAAITQESATSATASSAELHQEPEFRSWLPDRGALDEMLQKVGERLGGEDSARDAEKVNIALKEEVDAATDRFFSPEVREIIVTRIRGAAISLRARKGDQRAIEALAVARAIKEAGLITSPPREIPFLVGFFQKALGLLAQQGGGQLRIPVAASSAG